MRSIDRTTVALILLGLASVLLLWWFAADRAVSPSGEVVVSQEDYWEQAAAPTPATSAQMMQPNQLQMAISILEGEEALGEEARAGSSIRRSGERYVLLSQPSASGVADAVVDLRDGRSTSIIPAGSYSFETGRGTIVYVEPQRVLVYRQDWPAVEVLRGSELGPDKSYVSEEGASFTPAEVHTDNSVTLSIFWDLSAEPYGEPVTNPATGKPRQLGAITLPLP